METGKNRFFNICEAYQSMLGKSDSVARDARRYRMVSESSAQRRVMHPRAKDIYESYDVDAYENVYIGRTDDYYSEEDDDSVYSKPTWTWSEDANDKDFAKEGPVYKLTDDGKRDFFEWLDAYQVGYSLGSGRVLHGRNESPEDEWDYLTNPGNGLSTEVVGSGVANESVLKKRFRRNLDIPSNKIKISESHDMDAHYTIYYGNEYQDGVNLTEEEFDRLVSLIRKDIRSDFGSIKLLDDGTYYRMAWEHLKSMNIPTPKYGDVADIVLIYSYEDEDENGEPIYMSDKITIEELVDAIYNKHM